MKIIFIGDIVGKNARDVVIKKIPDLRTKYQSDVIICNAENAAAGYGLTKKIALDLFDIGVDAITLGNHAWDQREMLSYIEECPKIIRPINYPANVPGKGFVDITLEDGRKLILMQVMLRLFMGMSLDDPFSCTKKFLELENDVNADLNEVYIDEYKTINLKIENIEVDYAGQECVGLKTGSYEIINAKLNNCLDKAISSGELSNLIINKINIIISYTHVD